MHHCKCQQLYNISLFNLLQRPTCSQTLSSRIFQIIICRKKNSLSYLKCLPITVLGIPFTVLLKSFLLDLNKKWGKKPTLNLTAHQSCFFFTRSVLLLDKIKISNATSCLKGSMFCEEKSKDFLVHTRTACSTQECNIIWHVKSITELEHIRAQWVYIITKKKTNHVKC